MIKEVKKLKKMEILKRSKELVNLYFKDKVDLGNHSYVNHLYHVSEDFEDAETKSLALLHDLLEDTEVTKEDLLEAGYSKEFVQTLLLLTNNTRSYDSYINRLIKSNNKIAMQIKIKDLLAINKRATGIILLPTIEHPFNTITNTERKFGLCY